jgi:hypothetical protein
MALTETSLKPRIKAKRPTVHRQRKKLRDDRTVGRYLVLDHAEGAWWRLRITLASSRRSIELSTIRCAGRIAFRPAASPRSSFCLPHFQIMGAAS